MRLAADQETTEEWWETKRHEYKLFTLEAVEVEVAEGDPIMAEARLKALDGILASRGVKFAPVAKTAAKAE